MGLTTLFGIIHESHYTILINFYIYLKYFQQKNFSLNKISRFQTESYFENWDRNSYWDHDSYFPTTSQSICNIILPMLPLSQNYFTHNHNCLSKLLYNKDTII